METRRVNLGNYLSRWLRAGLAGLLSFALIASGGVVLTIAIAAGLNASILPVRDTPNGTENWQAMQFVLIAGVMLTLALALIGGMYSATRAYEWLGGRHGQRLQPRTTDHGQRTK